MSKKRNKQGNIPIEEVIKLLRECSVHSANHSAKADLDLKELNERAKDDDFLETLNNSVEECVDERIEQLTKEYQKEISRCENLVHKAERKLSDVKYELQRSRDTSHELWKEIKHLKKTVKVIKQILKHIAYCNGAAPVGASLRKIKRGYKHLSALRHYYVPPIEQKSDRKPERKALQDVTDLYEDDR
jgi:predicted RNase H-like nuclease (RuvC/YqgF family)